MSSRVGRTALAHCTALGRVLLAFNPDKAEAILEGPPLEAPTARTVVDPKALRALLAQVNEQGYALDLGEYESEVRCVAAPIRNHSGAVVAAMSVSGPAQRIEPMLTEGLVPEVRAHASDVSREAGLSEGGVLWRLPGAPAAAAKPSPKAARRAAAAPRTGPVAV